MTSTTPVSFNIILLRILNMRPASRLDFSNDAARDAFLEAQESVLAERLFDSFDIIPFRLGEGPDGLRIFNLSKQSVRMESMHDVAPLVEHFAKDKATLEDYLRRECPKLDIAVVMGGVVPPQPVLVVTDSPEEPQQAHEAIFRHFQSIVWEFRRHGVPCRDLDQNMPLSPVPVTQVIAQPPLQAKREMER
jgi:hypothetical protein